MTENLAEGVQSFTSNVFLVDGDRTVLVDPGSNFDVVAALEERDVALDAVVLTHTHPDHVGNVDAVKSALDVDAWGYDPDHQAVDAELTDGDRIRIGNADYRVLHTPGHKNDHVCLYSAEASTLFSGDLVFAGGGFGRTDLEEGDRERLVRSIEYVLETVTDDFAVMHAGHGPSVDQNPFADVQTALRMARAQ
ncbi:MAG: MBL fold metallo-hydrolase [Halanaeroarchaeum sp.]